MTDADLTPPTAEAKPKRARKERDPNAPTKPRGPRVDYGYNADSVIGVVTDKQSKHRGLRKEWYDSIVAFSGRTVKEWEESRKEQKDAPRGWLRHFVQEGFVTLTKPAEPEAQAA